MRGSSTIWLAFCLGVAASAPHALSTPFTCATGQIIFQQANGKLVCIAPDTNPCPEGQVLEKGSSSRVATSTSKYATCKPLPARAPFTCPAGQIIFQQANGKLVCIAPDANPCPAGQVLEKPVPSKVATSASKYATCKPLPARAPFSCPAEQIVFQTAIGKLVCIASDANPCPQGQVLDKPASSGAAKCKGLPARTPFTCPPGQVAVQQATGKFVCVASP